MLGDPKRLRTPNGYGYLVSWKHRLRVEGEEQAMALARRILADPTNVAALRAGIGQPEAPEDELLERLVTGLAGGTQQLLKTWVKPPVMDRPPETNLFDLLPPPEPQRELASLTFEVVDSDEQGVAVRYQAHVPSGEVVGALPAGERRIVRELERDADVEVTLSGIVLPLREDEDDAPRPDDDDPVPLRPGGAEPEVSSFTLHRTAPSPFEVVGPLALPGQTPEHRHFIPVVLSAVKLAREEPSRQVWVVGLGPSETSGAQLVCIQAVVTGDRNSWVECATDAGSLDEIRSYLAHLRIHRGWSTLRGACAEAELEAFQAEHNRRFDAAIVEDGICGVQTLGAVFDVLRDELKRWLPMFGLSQADLAGCPLEFVGGDALDASAPRRPESDGIDVWVFEPQDLPAAADLDTLYVEQRADVVPIDIPWSFERDALVVRLRAESVDDLAGYVAVRLSAADGSGPRELPLQPEQRTHDLVFEDVPTEGRYTVSLVAEDGRREVLVADQCFASFLDDRGGPT